MAKDWHVVAVKEAPAETEDDQEGYRGFINKVKTDGYTYQEKDKQALNEANDTSPQKILLKARLYFDGGYLSKALELLLKYINPLDPVGSPDVDLLNNCIGPPSAILAIPG